MADEFTRLHITPLNASLLKAYVPESVEARNVSFHELKTFPERSYGYVEVSQANAAKLRKKLHGAILKGTKVSVEEARPKESHKQPKKRRRGVEVLELQGRKVKRGWTDPTLERRARKQGRDGVRSKFTTNSECLFKARLRGEKQPTVVHEFAKATKFPTFLKTSRVSTAPIKEYVDGKGWVNEDGEVVEAARPSRTVRPNEAERGPLDAVADADRSPVDAEADKEDDATTHAEMSLGAVSTDAEFARPELSVDAESLDAESDAGSSDAESDTESTGVGSDIEPDDTDASSSDTEDDADAGSDADADSVTKPKLKIKVHPLEALYKTSEKSTFTFGINDDIDDEPVTPYREIRSGAPTPDTAHNRRFFDDPSPTDFHKWFFGHRGEANRSWKARRREVAKTKRYRENKNREGRD